MCEFNLGVATKIDIRDVQFFARVSIVIFPMAFLLCCLVDAAFKARRLCAAGDIFPVVALKVS